jgi:hypothetical protein
MSRIKAVPSIRRAQLGPGAIGAQAAGLPYRRLPAGCVTNSLGASEKKMAQEVGNLRYGASVELGRHACQLGQRLSAAPSH